MHKKIEEEARGNVDLLVGSEDLLSWKGDLPIGKGEVESLLFDLHKI